MRCVFRPTCDSRQTLHCACDDGRLCFAPAAASDPNLRGRVASVHLRDSSLMKCPGKALFFLHFCIDPNRGPWNWVFSEKLRLVFTLSRDRAGLLCRGVARLRRRVFAIACLGLSGRWLFWTFCGLQVAVSRTVLGAFAKGRITLFKCVLRRLLDVNFRSGSLETRAGWFCLYTGRGPGNHRSCNERSCHKLFPISHRIRSQASSELSRPTA